MLCSYGDDPKGSLNTAKNHQIVNTKLQGWTLVLQLLQAWADVCAWYTATTSVVCSTSNLRGLSSGLAARLMVGPVNWISAGSSPRENCCDSSAASDSFWRLSSSFSLSKLSCVNSARLTGRVLICSSKSLSLLPSRLLLPEVLSGQQGKEL